VITDDHSWGFYGALHSSGLPAIALLMVMQSESGMRATAWHKPAPNRDTGEVDPDGGAHGLIQMIPSTLRGVGWNDCGAAFRQLTAEQQMPYVVKYFQQKHFSTPLDETALYLAGYHPADLAHANEPHFILTREGSDDYRENGGVFDVERKGWIEVGDLTRRLHLVARGARWIEAVGRLELVAPPMRPLAFWGITITATAAAAGAVYWWLNERAA
jgi:hypothetical protein